MKYIRRSILLVLVALVLMSARSGPSVSFLHAAGAAAGAQETDTDGDTMPDAWETFFGLDPNDAGDATGDPDSDGRTNAQEFADGRHPNGVHMRYFAEGSTGYFDTSVGVLNLSETETAHVAIALLNEVGGVVSHRFTLGPRARQTVSINAVLGISAAVAIVVESDVPVAADRWMTWGTSGIGASLDSGAPAPATTWYFAEGATGPFLLYYLFENPGMTPATVTIQYLIEARPPVTTTHTLPPQSRTTIPVNQDDPALAIASVGSVITSTAPIFAERAMYVNAGGTLGGGSASAGSNQLSTQWYFGEGSTGPFFQCFLSLLNPGATDATATVTYHMSDGSTASKAYPVPAAGRRTVYFNGEAETDPALASLATGPVWFTVNSTQPILGERAMWWREWPWYEGHSAPGNTMSAVSWAVPEGRDGGATREQTYVLIGNTTTTPGQVRLTLIPDTGAPSTREVPIAAGERLTVNIGNLFGLTEARFSIIVESLGTTPVPLAVDYARYRSVNGVPFSGGGAAPAVPITGLGDTAPSVTTTTPAANATGVAVDANLTVTFSEPVNAGAGAFVLECPAATPVTLTNLTVSPATTFTLEPAADLPVSTACTLRIVASQITDADTIDPPDAMAADVVVPFTTSACAAITVSPTTVPGGTANVAYAPVTFTQTGGTAPVSWSLSAGTLPGGMSLSAAGVLAGTPTASGSFTFTATVTDANSCTGSAPRTLSILSGPNQAPSFTAGPNQTSLEDAGPQAVAGWATGISPGPSPDESGQVVTFTVTGNTNAALFSLAPAISPAGLLTYTAAPNANGAATITVQLQDNGGTAGGGVDTSAPQSFTITVTPVNDAPSFIKGADPIAVVEDSGLTTLIGWATAISAGPTDETGQVLTFNLTGNTNPALFAVLPALDPATGTLTFTLLPDVSGTTTLTWTLSDTGGTANGGANTSAPQTLVINVGAVNDPPVAVSDAVSTDEDTVLTVPPPGVLANDIDPDAGDTRTVVAVNGLAANVGTQITLASGALVTVNPDGSGADTLTAVAAFQALVTGQSATDTFTYTIQDAAAVLSTATVTVTITGVSDGPAIDLDADNSSTATGANYQFTFTDGDPARFIADATDATITDVDSTALSTLTVTLTNLLDTSDETLEVDLTGFPNFATTSDSTTNPAQFVLTITTATPQPIADFQTLLRRVTYQNTDGNPDTTPRVITVVANDGTVSGNTATSTVTIVAVNSPPTADNDAYSVAEGGALNVPAPGVLDGDVDPEGDAPITAVLVTGPANASAFTLNADGSFAYTHNGSETTTDSFTYQAVAGGLSSATATVTITITAVNDAPVVTAGTTFTFTEGDAATPIAATLTATDADDTNLESATVQITANYQNGQDVLAFTPQAGITGVFNAATGTLTLMGTSSVANYQAALRTVAYANGSNNPSQLTRTVTFVVNDGDVSSAGATSTINVVAVNDAPLVVNETFELLGNTELRVDMTAGTAPHTSETTSGATPVEGVLDNDSDPEGDPFAITAVTGCTDPDGLLPFDCTLPGGAVLHIAANGEFSYTPAPGAATGSFTYTVADVPSQGLPASVSGTVTFTFFDMIWYVDADAPAGGNGTSRLPFNTFTATTLSGPAGAGDLDDADDYIFLHGASAAITTGIELEANQHLIGEAAGLAINRALNGNVAPVTLVPANAAQRPFINPIAGSAVAIGGAVANEVTGLALGSTINAIDLTTASALSGAGTLTISNNVIDRAGAEGIDVTLSAGTTGTLALAIIDNTWNAANAHVGNAVDITRAAGSLSLAFSNNTNIRSNAGAIVINGGAVANTVITSFANNSVHPGTLGAGVVMTNVTFDGDLATAGLQSVNGGTLAVGVTGDPVGTTGVTLTPVQGSLFFTDLDVFAGASGLIATGTGTGLALAVTPVSSGGSSSISAANGPAVDVGTAAIDLQLASLTSTTSAGGVALASVTGTFGAATGSLTKSSGAGTAFAVSGSNVAVAYAGSLNVTSGAGVSLTGNNAAAAFTFSGGMTLTTGTNAAFTATGGGTVNVCDENPCNPAAGALVNTITTTTGTALNVANTTIGTGGLTFRSISANGAPNGIILNQTGTTAGLTVSGTGPAGSGGTIQNITNRGASFINAVNVSLTDMNFTNANTTDGGTSDGVIGSNTDENAAINLQNVTQVDLTDLVIDGTAQHGINGSNVTDLDITNTTIQNTGDEVWESNIYLWDLKGLASAARTSVFSGLNLTNDSGQFNIWIQNNDGTNDRPGEKDRVEISNSTFTRNGNNALISDNISVFNSGTGNTQVVVSNSTFTATATCGSPAFAGACVSDNIQVDAGNNAAFDFDLSAGNTLTNGNAGQAAVNVSASGAGQGTFNVRNIATSVRAGQGINVSLTTTDPAASLRGTIANNTISTNVANNPGSGIQMVLEGAGTMAVDVNNNTINGNATNQFDFGIRGGARAGTGTADFQINNNSVPSAEVAGVWFFAGNATGGETSRTCVNFISNLIDGDPALSFTDYFVEMYTGTTFRLQSLAGSGTNAVNVGNFISSTDDDPAAGDPVVDAGSGTTVNYTNAVCATP